MWIKSKVTLLDEFDRKILEKGKKYWLIHFENNNLCCILGDKGINYKSSVYPKSFFDI